LNPYLNLDHTNDDYPDWRISNANGAFTLASHQGMFLMERMAIDSDGFHIARVSAQDVFLANGGGNVGIGTTNATDKLTVNGRVKCEELWVDTVGADFVFEEGYSLMPLDEVETYIERNGHLPEIASAVEMRANGLGVGEFQTQLLQKIEELTLHVIEQNKRIEALETECATR
jgi:hypothetical protein